MTTPNESLELVIAAENAVAVTAVAETEAGLTVAEASRRNAVAVAVAAETEAEADLAGLTVAEASRRATALERRARRRALAAERASAKIGAREARRLANRPAVLERREIRKEQTKARHAAFGHVVRPGTVPSVFIGLRITCEQYKMYQVLAGDQPFSHWVREILAKATSQK